MTAMRRGATAVRSDVRTTMWIALILWTKRPVVRLRAVPTMTEGRIRRAAWRAEWCWTSWKLVKSVSRRHNGRGRGS
jgi:hypothetical protein